MLELIGVDGLTQWDVGRQVKVDKDVDMVHFSNRPYGYSKNVKVTDGVADVPDMFLTSCAPLRVWAYVGDFEKGYTKIEKIYEVKPKNRPEDYIYTPEEVKTWEKLQSEIGDLSNLETKAKENLVVAINEAAKSGENDYKKLTNLPQINGVELVGNKTGEELGLVPDLSGYATKDEIPVVPESLPNPNALTFTGAVNAVYDGSSAVSVEIPSGGGGGTDISLGLTSAAVGQTIKVKAVDESGKPTEWEAAEMDEDFELINEITVAEDVGSLTISVDKNGNPFELKEAAVLSWTVPFAESTNDIGRAQGFSPDSRWGYHIFAITNTLPAGKSNIGRYDLIHVKVVNGYIMQMGRWLSQNSSNVIGNLMMSTAASDAPFNFEIKDDEGTPTLKNPQGNITCYKIVSYGNPAIAAGSIIRLYGKRV